MSKTPKNYTDKDYDNYEDLMIMTNALHRGNDEDNPHPKGSGSTKWKKLLSPIWYRKKSAIYEFPKKKEGYEGEGVVVIPSDPNTLLERLDLLLASQEAGHTGVGNELVSICDELKRQGVLNTKTYKKLNSIIKKMIIITKHVFNKRYAYGGSGIFDTIANFLTRIFMSSAAKQIASSAMDVGKSVAKEGERKL